MSSRQRIKGQEITVIFTSDSGDEDSFGACKSAEFELDIELLREQYLSQTSDSFDEIYHGVTGNSVWDLSSLSYLKFGAKVQDRAERRTAADGKFSITFSLNFPTGEKARLTLEDVHFGSLPLKFGGRAQYGEGTVNFGCERLRRVY